MIAWMVLVMFDVVQGLNGRRCRFEWEAMVVVMR